MNQKEGRLGAPSREAWPGSVGAAAFILIAIVVRHPLATVGHGNRAVQRAAQLPVELTEPFGLLDGREDDLGVDHQQERVASGLRVRHG